MDGLSITRSKLLHPILRDEAITILSEIDKATSTANSFCRYTFTLRSIAEQDGLYALGRTKVNPDGKSTKKPKGNIVTNARGGQSMHNYGLAIDIAFVVNKEGSWETTKDWDKDGISDWMEVVRIFKKYGWEWGGDWSSFKDMPHFQKVKGYTTTKLLALVKSKKIDREGYIIF